VFTAIECASSALRLQMPSSNNVETMFVQHYWEKGPTGVGMWQLATSRQWCHNRDQFGLILLPEQYITTVMWKWQWCHYKDQSWKWHWCHYKDIRRHGSRNCSSMSSIKITQVGSNAATSRPMRRRIEVAVMPQVKSAWRRNQSRQWCRKKDLVWSHTAFIAA
jgi:hypothetical protein